MKTFTASSTPETIDFLSQKAYGDLESLLEDWYKLSQWYRIYDNGVKLGKQHVIDNFNLVVEDYCEGVVEVTLRHKENDEYQPFKTILDKEFGEVK